MPRYTIDTSTIIARRVSDIPDTFLFSTVVLLELMASAKDDKERRQLETLYSLYRKDNRLIIPDHDDWLLASKVLFWLSHGRRKQHGGKLPKLTPGKAQRMAMDALLATSARRFNVTVITDNYDDFNAMRRYIRGLKVVRGSDFFK
jgi:predicted nucleic acid-binding protein